MSTAPMTRPKAQPMCALTIGFQTYLLPSSDGLKVMQLLQQASECECDYVDRGYVYRITGPASIELKSVLPQQVRLREVDPHAPRRTAAKPLLIGSGS